jgi:hypothetical protein
LVVEDHEPDVPLERCLQDCEWVDQIAVARLAAQVGDQQTALLERITNVLGEQVGERHEVAPGLVVDVDVGDRFRGLRVGRCAGGGLEERCQGVGVALGIGARHLRLARLVTERSDGPVPVGPKLGVDEAIEDLAVAGGVDVAELGHERALALELDEVGVSILVDPLAVLVGAVLVGQQLPNVR